MAGHHSIHFQPVASRDSIKLETLFQHFTGREKLIEAFEQRLRQPPPVKVLMLYGVGDVGKTWLSHYLQAKGESDYSCPCARVNFRAGYTSHHAGDALWWIRRELKLAEKSFQFSRFDLLWGKWWERTHHGLPVSQNQNLMPDEANDILEAVAEVVGVGFIPKMLRVVRSLGRKRLQPHIQRWLEEYVGQNWRERLNQMNPVDYEPHLPAALAADLAESMEHTPQRSVIFIDTYEDFASSEERTYVQTLAEALWYLRANALLVICGRDRLKWRDSKEYLEQLRVGELTYTETKAFLRKCQTDRLAFSGERMEAIWNLTHGYAGALGKVIDLLKDSGIEQAEQIISDMGAGFTDNRAQDWRMRLNEDLLNRILEHLKQQERVDLIGMLRVASILRWFHESLLFKMTGERDTFQDYYERLLDYSFIEPHTLPNGEQVYRMHTVTQSLLAQNIRPASQKRKWHAMAMEYFHDTLERYEQEREAAIAYVRWYEIEDPNRQVVVTEWLYHLFRADDPLTARVHFAAEFLGAFYWWGWYVRYPFLDELIECLSQQSLSDENKAFLEQIRMFHISYTVGTDEEKRHAPPESWHRVIEALQSLRDLCNVEQPVLSEEQQSIRAITANYLGDAHRYLGHIDEAEAFYQEAYEYVEDENDRAWMRYFLSGLYLDCHALLQALQAALDSMHRLFSELPAPLTDFALPGEEINPYKEVNHELIANLYRVRADIYYHQEQYDRSMAFYNQAVFFAYAFHGCPKVADPYSQKFYDEITSRVANRLLGFWAREAHKEKVLQYCEDLRRFWMRVNALDPEARMDFQAMIEDQDVVALKLALFPANALDEDIGGTEYQKQVLQVVNALAGEMEII
jgi:hypothetical protein